MTQPLGSEVDHYWRVQSMARCAGVDLVTQVESGGLDQQAWSDMVQRCRGCDWTEGCTRWMDRQRRDHPNVAAEVPASCVNASTFKSLQEVWASVTAPAPGEHSSQGVES